MTPTLDLGDSQTYLSPVAVTAGTKWLSAVPKGTDCGPISTSSSNAALSLSPRRWRTMLLWIVALAAANLVWRI
jgi:hypothetical protein